MAARLPPLNALRAFEAAARHLSFAKAADELAVTPAAISHQVKALEEHLGIPLFRRYNRQVLLTDAGQALAPGIRDGLAAMAGAVERVNAICCRGPLTVTTPPSLAVQWLLRRLERFRAANPEIDVRVSASDRLVDLEREEVDVALRYGAGPYPGLVAEKLMGECVYPVCSPALLEGPYPLRTPDDLRHHTLLHDYTRHRFDPFPDWAMWLKAAGVEGIDAERGPSYEPSSMVIQAAAAGEGVALGRSVLVAEELAAGRLVRPFDTEMVMTDFAYWIVTTPTAAELPRVIAFREWLKAEVAADAAPTPATDTAGPADAANRRAAE